VTKKRKLNDDVDALNVKLDLLVSTMSSSMAGRPIEPDVTVSEPPPPKRVRVTREDEDEVSTTGEGTTSWKTTIFRNFGLASLAAGSYYLQHVYGKTGQPPTAPTQKRKVQIQTTKKAVASVLQDIPRVPVGKSGFVV
jgi:hypothetical protein